MKKTNFKTFSIPCFMLVLFLLLIINIDTVHAAEKSGQCGNDLYWTLDENGVMIISGEGKMWDYRNDESYFDYHECPWADYKNEIKQVVFIPGITYVGADAFHGCENITQVTFTDSITEIGPFSFMYCTNLENVTLPNKLASLGQQSFHGCEKITTVTIPDTVTYLNHTFQNCTALKEVYIGGITICIYAAFRGCTSLEKIEVSKNHPILTVIDGLLYDKDTQALLQYPLGRKDKKIILPENTVSIADFALEGANYLEEIVLPEGLTTISYSSFNDCAKLKSLTIPSTVEYFSNEICRGCYSMEYINNKSNTPVELANGQGTVWFDTGGNFVKELKNGYAYQYGLALDVDAENQTLNIGESVIVPNHIYYSHWLKPQNKKDLIFETSNPNVATIDENGKILAKKVGIAKITIRNRYTYKTEYENNDFKVTITVKVTDSIEKADITLSQNIYIYDGNTKKPAVTVKVGENVLVKNTDYTVSYSNNKNSGIATVTVTGKGCYTGKITKEFTINPSIVAGFTYSARSSSAVALKWEKNTSATGYVIEQYKNGKWEVINTITNNTTVSYKATGLSASTANKFRIKAYKTVGAIELFSGYTSKTINTLPSGVAGFTYSARSSNAVALKWTKNTSANGYVIEQYKSGKWVVIKTITSNTTTNYKATGLSASTANKFRIKAYKNYGSTKLYSGYVTKSINTLPAGVAGFTYSARTNTSITLKWNKNTSTTGYVIEQYKNGKWVVIKTITKNSTVSHKVSGLKKATSYKFRIKAYKSYGSTKLYSGYVTKTITTR